MKKNCNEIISNIKYIVLYGWLCQPGGKYTSRVFENVWTSKSKSDRELKKTGDLGIDSRIIQCVGHSCAGFLW